ncbi:MAG: hypothetical protein EZS28_022130 [Streblomastix strix]|uniref:HECT domain-containing protein n=1 Tax=Streblomastix strix TaxID=222440 RepID=A0A5J4VIE2_9EUKA|nr:MAG: hypothetical protein EZS28_022130 [Streblomastix strix]
MKRFAYLIRTDAGDYDIFAITLMNIYANIDNGTEEKRDEKITVQNENAQSSLIAKLPDAHQCFNHIDIPPYTSKQMLEPKLAQIIKLSTSADGCVMN